jgi:hypothetical protein
MTKKISKKEKDKRWLELQKTRMHEKIKNHFNSFKKTYNLILLEFLYWCSERADLFIIQ